MVKCANCPGEAMYTYKVSDDYLIHYCQYHLPKFLIGKRNAGQLPLVAPKTTKTSKTTPVVEEPVVEEEPEVVPEDAAD